MTGKAKAIVQALAVANGDAGEMLRAYREQAGLSQSALARAAGLTGSSISNAEAGRHWLKRATLHRIAGVLAAPAEIVDVAALQRENAALRTQVQQLRQQIGAAQSALAA